MRESSCLVEEPALPGATALASAFQLLAGLFGPIARKGVLALVDQAVVSGTSFLTTITIGRICGAGDLGLFTLGYGWLLVLGGVQQSLIWSPYVVYSNRLKRRALAVYAGSVLVQQGLLSVCGAVLLALGAAACWILAADPRLAMVLAVLAIVMPFFSLRGFVRGMMIARLDISWVLAFDIAVSSIQLGAFLGLLLGGALTVVSACAVVGIACGLPAAAWFVLARRRFMVRVRRVWIHIRLHWSFGKWMCASQLTDIGQRYVLFWLLAASLGTVATGIYAACCSVVLLFNPLTLALGNVLGPKAAQANAEGGTAEVRRVVLKATLLLGIAMAVACTALALCGELSLKLFYGGDEYAGNGAVVALLALSTFLSALSFAADNGLWVMERPDLNFRAGLSGLVITLTVAALLVQTWGILGVALANVLGVAVASAIQITSFSRLCRAKSGAGEPA